MGSEFVKAIDLMDKKALLITLALALYLFWPEECLFDWIVKSRNELAGWVFLFFCLGIGFTFRDCVLWFVRKKKRSRQEREIVESFFLLTRQEQSVLLQMYFSDNTTQYQNIESPTIARLVSLGYLKCLGPKKLSRWGDQLLVMVTFTSKTTSLLNNYGDVILKRFNDEADAWPT